jgi:hypothetical protein
VVADFTGEKLQEPIQNSKFQVPDLNNPRQNSGTQKEKQEVRHRDAESQRAVRFLVQGGTQTDGSRNSETQEGEGETRSAERRTGARAVKPELSPHLRPGGSCLKKLAWDAVCFLEETQEGEGKVEGWRVQVAG